MAMHRNSIISHREICLTFQHVWYYSNIIKVKYLQCCLLLNIFTTLIKKIFRYHHSEKEKVEGAHHDNVHDLDMRMTCRRHIKHLFSQVLASQCYTSRLYQALCPIWGGGNPFQKTLPRFRKSENE